MKLIICRLQKMFIQLQVTQKVDCILQIQFFSSLFLSPLCAMHKVLTEYYCKTAITERGSSYCHYYHFVQILTIMMVKCCFTSTETVGLYGMGAQDGHLDFHTASEL